MTRGSFSIITACSHQQGSWSERDSSSEGVWEMVCYNGTFTVNGIH